MSELGRGLVLSLLAVLLTEALWFAGILGSLEADLADGWHDLRGVRSDLHAPIVIIAVDDTTLERLTDPVVFWGPRFATAFETLRANGSTVIGLDFLTKVSGEDFFRRNGLEDLAIGRSWDASFRRNLFQKDIVLVAQRNPAIEEQDLLDLPIGEYRMMIGSARARIGLDNLPHERDGVVRRWRPVVAAEYADRPEAPLLSLSLALVLQHLGLPAEATGWQVAGRTIPVSHDLERLVYAGPPGTWPRIPLWKLLQPELLTEADRTLLNGSIALVGATHTGSTDQVRSPYSSELMFGVEVHANAVGTLLSGLRLWQPGLLQRILLVWLWALASALAFLRFEPRMGGVALGSTLVLLPVLGYGAFVGLDVLLPVVTLGLGTAVTYAVAFTWRYLGEEREKRHLRSVFSRYVSDAVVNDILSSPRGLALGGARREITVLFSDIRNFTTLSEALEPEEIVEMLNVYFERACKPILDQGGVVDKFIGDAVMAVFGAPVPSDDHADRALVAALELSAQANGFAAWMEERFGDRGLPAFDVGIGIHTGDAVVGNIGFERRTEYTVIGDAVNVASRLEGLTKGMGCRLLVSQECLNRASGRYATGRSSQMTVKGREEPVAVVEVLGLEGP